MKKTAILIGIFSFSQIVFGQGLLDMNENLNAQNKYASEVEEFGDKNIIPGEDAKKEAESKPFPVLNFGSDISAGSDAIGFRPTLLASTSLVSKHFFVSPSIRKTQVDDQKFTKEKTGQSLFIRDISNFSVNLDATFGFKQIKESNKLLQKKEEENDSLLDYRFGINSSFSFRGNSLFSPDSTSFESVKSDIQTVNLTFGLEYIAFVEHLSFYGNFNMMSITNNRGAYHAYFPANAMKDFMYGQFGMKFKVLEGQDIFKNVIIDFSIITIGERMKTIVGTNNTIIPLLKVGYVQRISLKKSNKPSEEKILNLIEQNKKLESKKAQLESEKTQLEKEKKELEKQIRPN